MFDVANCPGIPMVSFCDIPLSQTSRHAHNYGRYAIGFDKDWGMKRSISPVHYIYEGSMCARVVRDIYASLKKDPSNFKEFCECMEFNLRTAILFYGKPYKGARPRRGEAAAKGSDEQEVIFYDEREWRYVPFADETRTLSEGARPDVRSMLSQTEYDSPDLLGKATTTLQAHFTLSFRANDIKYLVVDNECELPEIFDFIYCELQKHGENTDLRRCEDDEKKRLMTRLISMCQIEKDF